MGKDVNMIARRGPAEVGGHNQDHEAITQNTLEKCASVSSENHTQGMRIVPRIEMFRSTSQESVGSIRLDSSVFSATDTTGRSADEIDENIDDGNGEVEADLVRRTLYSDEVPLHSEVATRSP